MVSLASPAAAFQFWRLPAKGVGLARMEFIITLQEMPFESTERPSRKTCARAAAAPTRLRRAGGRPYG